MNPSSTLGVFGGSEANLRLGLETMLGVLNASSRQGLNAELTRYTLSLMVLERKLSAAKGAMDTLGDRINGLQRQLDHFDLQSETLMSAMAGIYVDVISPLGPRIQVTGSRPSFRAHRFRLKYALPCWLAFALPCSGIRLVEAVCNSCFLVIA